MICDIDKEQNAYASLPYLSQILSGFFILQHIAHSRSIAMSVATPVTIVGATGLTGGASLKHLLASKTALDITTITRKPIKTASPRNTLTTLSHVQVDDLFEVPKSDRMVAKPGSTYVSCLASTRAAAGSFAAQEKIDVTLNVDMARRAKEQGAERVSQLRNAICQSCVE